MKKLIVLSLLIYSCLGHGSLGIEVGNHEKLSIVLSEKKIKGTDVYILSFVTANNGVLNRAIPKELYSSASADLKKLKAEIEKDKFKTLPGACANSATFQTGKKFESLCLDRMDKKTSQKLNAWMTEQQNRALGKF